VRQFWFDLLRPFGLQDFHLGLDMDDFDLFGVLIVVVRTPRGGGVNR
jgi:hypothetical protein